MTVVTATGHLPLHKVTAPCQEYLPIIDSGVDVSKTSPATAASSLLAKTSHGRLE